MYCEDFPCCGHTNDDPCQVMPYDAPGYYENDKHLMCDHSAEMCDAWEDEPEECEVDEDGWCYNHDQESNLCA